jgi:hypothetical protein
MGGEPGPNVCPNCGSAAPGHFCPECGQRTDLKHRSIGHLLSEFLEDYLTLDNKLFKSLVPLFTKPGQLTVDYIAGRRQRHVSPFRLFMTGLILFIFVISFMPYIETSDSNSDRERDNEVSAPLKDASASEPGKIADASAKTAQESGEESGESIGRRLLDNLITSFHAVMVCMLPVFALIMRLLYLRRKEYLFVDHMVFSLHLHSYALAILTLLAIVPPFPQDQTLVAVVIAIYLYAAQRRVFSLSRARAVTKTALVVFTYTLLTLAVLGIVTTIRTFGIDTIIGWITHRA